MTGAEAGVEAPGCQMGEQVKMYELLVIKSIIHGDKMRSMATYFKVVKRANIKNLYYKKNFVTLQGDGCLLDLLCVYICLYICMYISSLCCIPKTNMKLPVNYIPIQKEK